MPSSTSPESSESLESPEPSLATRLLAAKAGADPAGVQPGDILTCSVDVAMAHEALAQVVKPFQRMEAQRVWAPEKVVVPIDHWVPASDIGSAKLHQAVRAFVEAHGLPHFYDLGRQGICHQILAEEGFVLPGDLVVGTDSHTNMAGALGAFACGIGPTEMAAVFATGKLWLKVPPTIGVEVSGQLQKGVYSKDLVLAALKQLTSRGAIYKAVEYFGGGIATLPMWQRFTLTNMTTEMGAKAGLIPADKTTLDYLRGLDIKNGRAGLLDGLGPQPASPPRAYERQIHIDGDNLPPQVAKPASPDNVCDLAEVVGTPVDQVFLGSCTNGRLEDLRVAAGLLKGHTVAAKTRFIVSPASTSIWKAAHDSGLIKTFMEAQALVTNATCGACFGGQGGILAPGETCLSTSNRNYPGRMGHAEAQVYLASPATAAATAIEGKITDPRRYL